MTYVDGFVLPLPRAKLARYRAIAGKAGSIWREHGALEYRECVIEDADAKGLTGFPALIGAKARETVVFSWITYRSRAHRDRVNKKVMQDPRMDTMMDPKAPLFDFRRMAYGGFSVIVAR
jgi:uncharacterized protein YbaA (DUF1428 family)